MPLCVSMLVSRCLHVRVHFFSPSGHSDPQVAKPSTVGACENTTMTAGEGEGGRRTKENERGREQAPEREMLHTGCKRLFG